MPNPRVVPSRISGWLERDRSLFARLSGSSNPVADAVLPRLSHAANHGVLWFGTAAALGLSRGQRRRGALRGVVALGVTSGIVNGPAKLLVRRERPPITTAVFPERVRRRPRTSSFPSGHAASAAAFATGVALESPATGIVVGAVAAAVAYSRIYIGVHYPGDVLAGIAIGAGAALVTTRMWPRRPMQPARARPASAHAPTLPDGSGLAVVVNGDSGPNRQGQQVAEIRELLPAAQVHEVEAQEFESTLRRVAAEARAIGVCGGDGSVNYATSVALEKGLPLAIFPGGTLNHFALDCGLDSVETTARAVSAGEAVAVDVGCVEGEPGQLFLNIGSLGGYAEIVETRERLQDALGKWPSVLLAAARVFRRGEALDLEVDGQPRRVWLLFAGNCQYLPAGFAPTYRERLDDGLLDIRIVDAAQPFARVRLLAALLSGRLGRCRVYEQRQAARLNVRERSGTALALARDGEVNDVSPTITLAKHPSKLIVYRPEEL